MQMLESYKLKRPIFHGEVLEEKQKIPQNMVTSRFKFWNGKRRGLTETSTLTS